MIMGMQTVVTPGIVLLVMVALAVRADDRPAATTTSPAAKRLEITANIDGSDELYITRRGFRWGHKHWDWPSDVRITGARRVADRG